MDVIVYGALCEKGREHECGRELLAVMLRQELGISALPEIAAGKGGKPCFPACPEICFNISHSYGAVVCAIHDHPVGVDVEKLRPAPKRLAAGKTDEAFFRWWTMGEAALKREGGSALQLLRAAAPNPLTRHLEGFLPGWIVAVCPETEDPIRSLLVEI